MSHVCELCKKKPATIHLTDIQGNVKRELHMCEECAQQKGIAVKHAVSLPQLLSTLSKKGARKKEPELACDVCGITWSEFRSKGRLGCAHDYTVFRDRLAEIITNIHGRNAKHAGKRPGVRVSPDKIELRKQLTDCRRRLQEAIDREAYEEAANLRDRLSQLKKQAGEEN
jgi:protein arginine kinase activator